ncbi:hypothetical protein Tco_1165152 [Tanacetum coccineum]
MDTNITTTFLFVVAMLTPQIFKKELLIELQTSSDGNVTLEKEVAANICGAMAFGCLVSAAIAVFLVTKTKKYSRSEAEKGATKVSHTVRNPISVTEGLSTTGGGIKSIANLFKSLNVKLLRSREYVCGNMRRFLRRNVIKSIHFHIKVFEKVTEFKMGFLLSSSELISIDLLNCLQN